MSLGFAPISGTPVSALLGGAPVPSSVSWEMVVAVTPQRRPVRPSYVPEVLLNLSPIPQPAPPTFLTWRPQFPVHPVRHRVRNFAPVVWCPQPPIFNLSWLPVFRVQPFKYSPPHPASIIDGDPGAQQVIPTFPTWQTMWTAPLRARVQHPQVGVWQVDMTTLVNAAPCVELVDVGLTMPQLLQEIGLSPSLTTEGWTAPALVEEDLC